MDPHRFATFSLQDARLLRMLSAGLAAADPQAAVRAYLRSHPLPAARDVYALAVGKAAPAMLEGLAALVPLKDALVITKIIPDGVPGPYRILQGGHPVPDERSIAAGEAALEFAARLKPDDLLVCLISGGGSALMAAPRIPLEQLQALTTALLRSGARIDEINTLRRHIDRVKGGGLAKASGGAHVLSLVFSDVVGSPLEAIASGPTAPDPTSLDDVLRIVHTYRLDREFLAPVKQALEETAKPGDPIFSRVDNRVIANVETAVRAVMDRGIREDFDVKLVSTSLQGEASRLGRELAAQFRAEIEQADEPLCMLAGGESTVTLHGHGLGGRNQELALAAMPVLDGLDDVLLVSLATDGEDGPTDAAGAVVTGASSARARSLGLDIAAALENNDSYPVFQALGDLIKTGSTGTNVNDILLIARL